MPWRLSQAACLALLVSIRLPSWSRASSFVTNATSNGSPARGQLTALVLIGEDWTVASLYVALDMAGYDVCVAVGKTSREYAVANASSKHVKQLYVCEGRVDRNCVLEAMLQCRPDIAFSTGDKTTSAMITLEEDVAADRLRIAPANAAYILNLIAASMPASGYRRILLDKAALVHDVAHKELSIRVPEYLSVTMAQLGIIRRLLNQEKPLPIKLPTVLKASKGVGGSGVYMARSKGDLWYLIRRVIESDGAPKKLVGSADAVATQFHFEQLVDGPTCLLAMCAWQGEVVAAVPACKNATNGDNGPSLVNAPSANTDMVRAGHKLAKGMHYSGCFSLDFMIDEKTGDSYLVDFNPRLNVGHVFNLRQASSAPLNVLEALYLTMLGVTSPSLGFQAPRDVDPSTAPRFVKLHYLKASGLRTVAAMFDANGDQDRRYVMNAVPWCDEGMMKALDTQHGMKFDNDTCTISNQGLSFVDHFNCPCHQSDTTLPYDL